MFQHRFLKLNLNLNLSLDIVRAGNAVSGEKLSSDQG